MQSLNDLKNLPFVDVMDPEYVKDPHKVIKKAREQSWIAEFNSGYMVLDYESMRDILSDRRWRTGNRDITAMMGVAEGTPFERFNNHFLQAIDGEQHDRIRGLIAPSFTPKEADKHRQYMRKVMHEVLDTVADKGKCDWTRVAAQYPISVMCRLLGISREDIATFEQWAELFPTVHSQRPEAIKAVDEAIGHMIDYADTVIQRRKTPGDHPDDLLQSLVEASFSEAGGDGDKLSDEELRILVVTLITAGYDTSKNQLIYLMKLLCDYPEEYNRLKADPSNTKAFIDEGLRFLNPIGMTFRLPNEDIQYRNIIIPANTFVAIPPVVAGRDPKANEDPDTFNPDGKKKNHLTFGYGYHMCVGMFLARALLEEALPIVVDRIRNPKIAGELNYRPFQAIWGLDSLPIEFEALKNV